jgi:hypothetical protein
MSTDTELNCNNPSSGSSLFFGERTYLYTCTTYFEHVHMENLFRTYKNIFKLAQFSTRLGKNIECNPTLLPKIFSFNRRNNRIIDLSIALLSIIPPKANENHQDVSIHSSCTPVFHRVGSCLRRQKWYVVLLPYFFY